MKGEKRPWILLYLLVGVLLLSTGLNFYFLLRLDAHLGDQELEAQLHEHERDLQRVSLQLPAAPPDTARISPP
jgi:hypothetical protein